MSRHTDLVSDSECLVLVTTFIIVIFEHIQLNSRFLSYIEDHLLSFTIW